MQLTDLCTMHSFGVQVRDLVWGKAPTFTLIVQEDSSAMPFHGESLAANHVWGETLTCALFVQADSFAVPGN